MATILTILVFGVTFFLLRAVYLRIRLIVRLFKNKREKEAWKVIRRTIGLLILIGIGIALLKYIILGAVAIFVILFMATLKFPPEYHYDD